jgi:SSS family solute:Na+ symporter
LLGGFFAVMLAAFISTHDTYLHSWGSIFIQDVILPFRKKELKPKEHIRLLRWSICGVAVFVFLFSLFFRQTEYIIMYFMITGAIWIGGAGAVVIGGLYWKRGTTRGAWAGLITGSVLATVSIILQQVHQQIGEFSNPVLAYIGSQNGAVLSFWASVGAIIAYVSFSLMGKKRVYNMDRLLHRGEYAVEDDKTEVDVSPVNRIRRILGIGRDFNLKDKFIYLGVLFWTLGLAGLFVFVTIWNLIFDVSDQWWTNFWEVSVWVLLIIGTAVTVWLGVGGLMDMKKMFERLRKQDIDVTDDGRAFINEQSASKEEV